MKKVPALVLDLDGTVRRSKINPTGFIKGIDDIELIPGMKEVIGNYKKQGFMIIGVSNQGGVAYGYKTQAESDAEMDYTQKLLDESCFHYIYTSFCMPEGKVPDYKWRSLLRKPDIGMLAIAEVQFYAQGYIIDWDHSLMVGDRDEDMALAKNACISFMMAHEFLKMHHEAVGVVASEKPTVKIDVQFAVETTRFASAKQKEEIIRLLNNPVITRQEKTKMLLNINRLDEHRASEAITKLKTVIEEREDGMAMGD